MPTFAEIDPDRFARLERKLEVRQGFLAELEHEDDWSYVVKLHTLMEAALTQLLRSGLGDPRLERVLPSLPLGSLRSGKLGFLRAFDLVGDFDMRFVRFVSELRGSLVEHIERVDFSIASYFAERTDSQLRQLYRAWGFAAVAEEAEAPLLRLFRESPKLLVQVRAVYFLELAYLGRPLVEAHRASAGALAELAGRAQRAGS
jgi:hypothetical protein